MTNQVTNQSHMIAVNGIHILEIKLWEALTV